MPVTLADVARRAGVSTATVSRVLNNKMVMPIPQHTVDRIRRAAGDLQYVPNRLARGLVTRRTDTIGFYTKEMTDPHGAVLLDIVEAAARERGYHVIVSARLESVGQAASVDGLIALRPPAEIRASPRLDCPVVYVYPTREPAPNAVGWSDYEAARDAARYLASLGHDCVAGIYGSDAGDKSEGFRAGAEEAGLDLVEYRAGPAVPPFASRAELNDFFLESGCRLTRQMLRERPRTTAVFARNDLVGAGVLRALSEAGISVPERVSVLSYYDTVVARCVAPSLTSVRTPIEEAGRLAVSRLIDAVKGGAAESPGVHLPTELVVRASTGPASQDMAPGTCKAPSPS